MCCKLIGITFVIFGSISFGINHAYKLKKRLDNLKEIERIIIYIENEIRYRQSVLCDACHNAALKSDKPFNEWLENLSYELGYKKNFMYENKDGYINKAGFIDNDSLINNDESFNNIWNSSLSFLRDNSYLRKSDLEELRNLGQTLGYLDINSQEMGIKLALKNIRSKIEDYNQKLPEKIKLSLIASGVCGILIVILFI